MLDDGYYVSAYTHADKISSALKITIRHDHCIALWKKEADKIRLVRYWELERITGLKHHHVAFSDREAFDAFLSGLLEQVYPPVHIEDILQVIGTPFSSDPSLDCPYTGDPDYTYHATAHLFTSLFMDSDIFYGKNILTLCVDAGSDPLVERDCDTKYNFYGIYSEKGRMERFPIPSPGPNWVIMKNLLGYEEGSLMALGTASKSESRECFETLHDEHLVVREADKKKAFTYVNTIVQRILSYREEDAGVCFNFFDEAFTEYENKVSMIVKLIQKLSIETVDRAVSDAVSRFGINPRETYFGMTGGYALNCPTNTHIQNKYGFIGQLTPPCVNDGGQALGIGLCFFHEYMPYVNFKLKNAYYGDADDLANILQDGDFDTYIQSIEKSFQLFAKDISGGPVVWFSGNSEIGPRALGNRSVLADPRYESHRDLLNRIKQREWWRPVAPIILEEELDNWFDDAFVSPYMLNIFTVREDKKSLIPAVNHVDSSSRVQTLKTGDNELLHAAIEQYFQATGIPILVNTSLNDKGEPIINTIRQALNFALRKNLRVMYVNGHRVELKNHESYPHKRPTKRQDDLFLGGDDSPFGITAEEYTLYVKKFRGLNLNPFNEKAVKKIKSLYAKYASLHQADGGVHEVHVQRM